MEPTRVVFHTFKKKPNEVIALFPDLCEGPGQCLSYVHLGQHGISSRGLSDITRPAIPEEYTNLLHELEHHVGYSLKILKRMPPERRQSCRT